jgi:hypothetical protein
MDVDIDVRCQLRGVVQIQIQYLRSKHTCPHAPVLLHMADLHRESLDGIGCEEYLGFFRLGDTSGPRKYCTSKQFENPNPYCTISSEFSPSEKCFACNICKNDGNRGKL